MADEHGGKDFKEGFIKYIKKRHIPDLFNNSEFKFSNSKSDLIVQVADIISGTLARCYETNKISLKRAEFLRILKNKIIEIRFWPTGYKPFAFDPGKEFKNYDPIVSALSLNLADQFVSQYMKTKIPSEMDQLNCLRYLVFYFRNINPETFISTGELIGQIENFKGAKVPMHYFRSKVIAKLRDEGVLIASSSKGYKLPASSYDLYQFINHSNTYIQPMIDRVMKCRDKIKLATKNKLDIIDHAEFKYLRFLKDVNI